MRSLFLFSVVVLAVPLAFAEPLTTAFTYQGELAANGSPAQGVFDLRFSLYDSASGGLPLTGSLCADNLAMSAGRFSVTLDFGEAFAGQERFLEIEVRADAGQNCAVGGGYVTLSPRQRLTAAPNAVFALAAGEAQAAADSQTLNGQPASFYSNAANLTGTLPDARLSGNVTTLSGNQTFSGAKTFSATPAFANPGQPFTVNSSTKVNSLNADLLDGLDSTAFAAAAHTHDATAITSGLLSEARIPSVIPRLSGSNVFSVTQAINVSTQTPLTLIGSNTGGTWVNLQNTGGGRTWNLIATGSTNGEGAGKLLIRDQTAGLVRATIDAAGNLGLGTTSPSSALEVSRADAAVRVRNTNDTGGGFILNTFATLQFGMFNPSGSAWFSVPANGQRSMLGVHASGRVGTLSNTSGSPDWRNTIDDGSGNAEFQGNITANNMPAVKHVSTSTGTAVFSNDSRTIIENITVNIPASGYITIHCRATAYVYTTSFNASQLFLELKETTGPEALIKESLLRLAPSPLAPDMNMESDLVIQHTIPVSAGVRQFKLRVRHQGGGGGGNTRGGEITVMYFPASL
jgi:hypothetical protein